MNRWFLLCILPSLTFALLPRAALANTPMELWLYYPNNFQANENNQKLEAIWRRAAKAGYTKILLTDSKFAKLGDLGGMERQYFSNVEKAKKLAAELKIELVPTMFDIGYSNNMLWHDPNLAEGLPVKEFCVFAANYLWPARTMIGEQLIIVVRPEPGRTMDESLRGEFAVRNQLLLPYKRVTGYLVWEDDFPLTASLKIKREVLAQPAIEDQHAIIIDCTDGELGVAGSAELPHGADP